MGLSEHEDQGRPQPTSEQQEQEEERRKLRRLQVMMNMVMSVISQDQGMTVEEASELVGQRQARRAGHVPRQGIRLRHPLQAAPAAPDGRALPAAVKDSKSLNHGRQNDGPIVV